MSLPHSRLLLPLSFASLLGVGALIGPTGPAQDLAVHAVRGPISYLEGAGGNVGLCLGDDGLVVIDDKLSQARGDLVEVLGDLSEQPARYLLNTHWHADHTGNNLVFGERRVPILAHENVRSRLAGEEWVEGNKSRNTPAGALPTLTYADSVTLHLNGEEIEVRYYGPGHTDGDSVVYFRTSKVVHMGDLFFNGMFPFIDPDSGGSPSGFVESVGAVLEEIDDGWRIIPGHGPLADREALLTFRRVVSDCVTRVREALDQGRTAQQMQAQGLLADYAEEWATGFVDADRFVALIAKGLAAEGR